MAKRGRKARRQRAGTPVEERSQPAPQTEAGPAQPQPAAQAVAAQPGTARALDSALIAVFLLFQIAMPLRYYVGGRGYDERFSWRMFSSVRMQRCDVRVRDVTTEGGERAVDLERELQVAWIGMLERYRPQVVEKFLRRRCGHDDVREARYERACRDTGGSQLPLLQVTLDCKSKKLQRKEGGS